METQDASPFPDRCKPAAKSAKAQASSSTPSPANEDTAGVKPGGIAGAIALYNRLFPPGSPRRKSGPWIVVGLVLVILLLGKCAVSSVGNKVTAITAARAEEKRVQTTGVLRVKSNRPDATVEAVRAPTAGETASTDSVKGAPGQALGNLSPGKYAVTLRAPGWPDAQGEIDVPAGRQTELTIDFKGGSLRLDSDPTGATVKFRGAVLGKTPLVIPLLPPGEVPLSLEYPGWPVVSHQAAITEGQETDATVRLPQGRLVVESLPAGATVLLGRQTLGRTPLTIERMPPGAKKLVLQARDFPSLETTVTITDGETAILRPVMGLAFPLLDPAELLRDVWLPDESRVPRATTGIYRPKNDVVKNLNRERLYNRWQHKIYRYAGTVKTHDANTGRLEFTEQRSDLARHRVIVQLKPGSPAVAKDAVVAVYGRLTAVEEPTWTGRVITFELEAAEMLPEEEK